MLQRYRLRLYQTLWSYKGHGPTAIFFLAMASVGRRSELQALVFDPQYIQFKPKGKGVSPEFMQKNQRPNQINDKWYIPAVPTGKPGFGAPNCPVREHSDTTIDI